MCLLNSIGVYLSLYFIIYFFCYSSSSCFFNNSLTFLSSLSLSWKSSFSCRAFFILLSIPSVSRPERCGYTFATPVPVIPVPLRTVACLRGAPPSLKPVSFVLRPSASVGLGWVASYSPSVSIVTAFWSSCWDPPEIRVLCFLRAGVADLTSFAPADGGCRNGFALLWSPGWICESAAAPTKSRRSGRI